MAFNPWGSEFSVNTTTAGDQERLNIRQFNDGRFMISWGSTDTGDGNLGTARGRVFDAFGSGIGNDYILTSTPTGGDERPRVQNMNNGNKLAIFLSDADGVMNNRGETIKGRFLDANGAVMGADFNIVTGAANTVQGSFLARFNDGSFGVVYTLRSLAPGDGSGASSWVQRLDGNGALVGTPIQINGVTNGDQFANDFIQTVSGTYLGLYQSGETPSGDGGGTSIRLRTFDSNFVATGDTVINNVVAGDQTGGSMGRLADGSILVTYESSTGDSGGTSAWLQFLTATGAPNGAAIRINSTETGDQFVGNWVQLPDGRLFFAFSSTDTGDGSGSTIRGRIFSATGVPEGNDFIINTTTAGDQGRPSARGLPDGRVVVAWESGSSADPNGREIKAQIFDPRGNDFTTTGASVTVASDLANVVTGQNVAETIHGLAGDDTLNGLGGNDVLFGDSGADTLNGGDGDDFMVGGQGNDALNGGNGADMAGYDRDANFGGALPVIVNLSSVAVTGAFGTVAANSARDAYGDTDTFTSIEQARGTAGADIFYGGSAGYFQGRAGADTYVSTIQLYTDNFYQGPVSFVDYRQDGGAAGININLATGTGTDTHGATETFTNILGVRGSMLADTITGNAYYNVFQGLQGADIINGGGGVDRLDYSLDAGFGGVGGVTVNFVTGTATDGWGNTDTITGIEQAIGTGQNDTFLGDATNNFFAGANGADSMDGGLGFDSFRPGLGADIIDGDAGDDQSYGDRDRVDYADLTPPPGGLGVIVNLSAVSITPIVGVTVAASTARDIGGSNDTLFDIERVRGTNGADFFRGSDTANLREERFEGLGGGDFIDGGAGYNYVMYVNESPNYSGAGFGGTQGVRVNLSTATAVLGGQSVAAGSAIDGYGMIDNLVNIRGIGGTGLADFVLGGAGYDWFRSFGGADSFDGGAGTNDTLSLYMDEGFFGIGGTGVTVTMAAGTAIGLDGATTNFVNVENIEGSEGNDSITGDGNINSLVGEYGNDTLDGGGNDDRLTGSEGNDTLRGGDGNDLAVYIYDPTFAAYAAINLPGIGTPPSGGVTANLATGTATDPYGDTDTLQDIEGVVGTFFADTFTGNGLDNLFYGLSGNDTIDGGGGNDTVSYAGWGASNGSGAPVLIGINASRPNGVVVNLTSGVANDGEGGTDTLTSIENVTGSTGADFLTGSTVANVLRGGTGNDNLAGGAGGDTLDGGDDVDFARYDNEAGPILVSLANSAVNGGAAAGDVLTAIEGVVGTGFGDTIYGDDLVNTLSGAAGGDFLIGAGGSDSLFGGDGDDNLDGGAGSDTLNGGANFDFARYDAEAGGIVVSLANSAINGGAALGDVLVEIEGVVGTGFGDTIYGDGAINTLAGGAGSDFLLGAGGNDSLFAGNDNDNLEGGAGSDTLNGGDGFDFARYDSEASGIVVSLANAAFSGGAATGDVLVEIEGVVGTGFADTIYGDNAINTLAGSGGDDFLLGAGGNDSLFAGEGNDYLDGGTGSDTLNGGNGFDFARYDNEASGIVVSLANSAFSGGAATGDVLVEIEGVIGSGFGDTIYGDGTDNTLASAGGSDFILGGGGNDSIFAGDDNDYLDGGAGSDTLNGGNGFDFARYDNEASGIVVSLANSAFSGGSATGDVLVEIEGIIGSGFNDTIYGDIADNTLASAGGDDFILGGGGNDSIFAGEGNDYLDGGAGSDTLNGGGGFDFTRYDNEASGVVVSLANAALNSGGAAGDVLTEIEGIIGTAFADTLLGDGGDNTLAGAEGADEYNGAGGNDFLIGGGGVDTFVFGTGGGHDSIADFTAGAGATDVLRVNMGAAFDTFAEVMAVAAQSGANTVITFDASHSVTLRNVTVGSLVADDIAF